MIHKLKMKLRAVGHSSGIYRYASSVKTGLFRVLPDKPYLKLKFRANTGERLDLDNPKTFNMKLQWLKLHDRNPLYSTLVDKFAVKQYVADKIGANYVIPIVGGPWNSTDEIDFDALPEQFVLKCNHDCGGLVICADKSKLDIAAARKKLDKALKHNYYWNSREWPYKNVKPCIFAEKYLVDDSGYELKDYKLFCFSGKPCYMFIASDRMNPREETKFDFFDMDFHHLPLTNGHPNAKVPPLPPAGYQEMKELAATLSEDIPHVRVDFYQVGKQIYFGEMTFYHWGGMMKFDPPEWDLTFGNQLILPNK